MIYEVYRTPGKPPRWWEKAIGFTIFWCFLPVWLVMVTITNNDNWPDSRPLHKSQEK